jgi:hypothetical protein
MQCCEKKEAHEQRIKAMNHEERLEHAKKMKMIGGGMIASSFAFFVGLAGGLWKYMGAGALGVAFGGASGHFFGSCAFLNESKVTLEIDAVEEAGNAGKSEEP